MGEAMKLLQTHRAWMKRADIKKAVRSVRRRE